MKRIVFVVLALVASIAAQERFVKPVDEAKLDPGFLAFRTKLIAAAERKDAKYVLSIVDPNIKNGFGGEDGIVKFKRGWKIDRKDSEFWAEFLPVIKNGGSFIGEGRNKLNFFGAPYIYSAWLGDLDAFEYSAIFGSDVNLRKSPGTDGEIVGKLSYNIVKIENEAAAVEGKMPEWLKIKTLGGLTGYAKSEFVRSSIDYRAGFEKKRGVWKMTFFLAGD